MSEFSIIVNATNDVVQLRRAANLLLYDESHQRGFAANEGGKNHMFSSPLIEKPPSPKLTSFNANDCSTNRLNNDIQQYHAYPNAWCYTCYTPRIGIVKVPRPQRAPFYWNLMFKVDELFFCVG